MSRLTPLVARVRGWLGEPLTGAELRAYREATSETVRRRLSVLAPLMGVLHILHVALFWTSGARRAALAPVVLEWRDALTIAHAATLVFTVLICVAVYTRPRRAIAQLVGPVTAGIYLLHGAAC